MKPYVVLRRCAWSSGEELWEAMKRAESAVQSAPDDIGWIRSYLFAEPDGSIGSACVYRATSPEAVRAHAERAGLPIDEIVALVETLVVEPDPVEAAT